MAKTSCGTWKTFGNNYSFGVFLDKSIKHNMDKKVNESEYFLKLV